MVEERIMDGIADTVQRMAGRGNRVLGVYANFSGYAIRLHKGVEDGEADYFFGTPVPCVFDSAKAAYDAMLEKNVEPYRNCLGKFEMPTIVYVQNIVITTEEEIA